MLWFLELGKKKPVKQCELIKRCNLKLVKSFHKLIKLSYDKFHRVPSEDRPIFKEHRVFLCNFMLEKDPAKKKRKLLRKARGGFLGVLIPALVSLVSSIPPFLGGGDDTDDEKEDSMSEDNSDDSAEEEDMSEGSEDSEDDNMEAMGNADDDEECEQDESESEEDEECSSEDDDDENYQLSDVLVKDVFNLVILVYYYH